MNPVAGVDEASYQAIVQCADAVAANPLHLLQVWYSESGFNPKITNSILATGIFQVIPSTLKALLFMPSDARWGAAEIYETQAARAVTKDDEHALKSSAFAIYTGIMSDFARLTASQQIAYAQRFYSSHKGELTSVARVYLANFMPAELAFGKAIDDPSWEVAGPGRYGWAYAQNSSFDENGDHVISMRELADAVIRNCRGDRYRALELNLCDFLGIEPPVEAQPNTNDLGTIIGLETALRKLGFYGGELDGIPGPMLEAAVKLFQANNALVIDGIAGPLTRKAIAHCLAGL